MTYVTIVLSVIIGAFVGLLTKIVGDLLRPEAEKHRKVVISIFVGLVALSAVIALRSSVDSVETAPITTPEGPTPDSGNMRIIHVTEGGQQAVVIGTDEIVVSVEDKGGGLWGFADVRTPVEKITATTPTDNQSHDMRVGDCLAVRPFTVTMHDVNTVGTDKVTLVVARLSADVDVATCKIAPTPTKPSYP